MIRRASKDMINDVGLYRTKLTCGANVHVIKYISGMGVINHETPRVVLNQVKLSVQNSRNYHSTDVLVIYSYKTPRKSSVKRIACKSCVKLYA